MTWPIGLVAQDCEPGEASIFLDGNAVTAQLNIGGDLWWDGQGKPVYYTDDHLLNGDSVSHLFTGGLWLSGVTESGNLRSAIVLYPNGNVTDFWPGPIRSDGLTDATACSDWDRFFKVNKSDVDAHLADYNANNTINQPIGSIYTWPGRDNPYFEDYAGYSLPTEQDLAPFVDLDDDGLYDPSKGEYPDIKGDQSIWWVYNDIGNRHLESGTDPIGVEVQVLAYAKSSSDPALDYTTFYDYKVINKWGWSSTEFYAGMFIDPDLGCYLDDFIGVDSTRNMAYCYNADDQDGITEDGACPGNTETYGEAIPILGITLLNSSVAEPALGSCIATKPRFSNIASDFTIFHHNLMQGKWSNGRPLTYGGSGYNDGTNTDTVRYIFPDEPSDPSGWSACSAGIDGFDNSLVMSSGPTDLTIDQTIELTMAAIYVPSVDYPCPSIQPLQDAHDRVAAALPSLAYVPPEYQSELLLVPYNHTSGLYTIYTGADIAEVVVYDISGRLCLRQQVTSSEFTIDISDQPLGMYIISAVTDSDTVTASKKVIKT